MEELLLALLMFLFESQYSVYAYAWVFICGFAVAVVPVKYQEKIPNVLMVIINVSALNFGNAVNKLTDLKGNKLKE